MGAATSTHRSGAYWLAGGVATSFTAAGLFVATIGFAIGLDGDLFRTISAVLLMLLGLVLLSATIQARLGVAAGGFSGAGDRIIRRLSPKSATGQRVRCGHDAADAGGCCTLSDGSAALASAHALSGTSRQGRHGPECHRGRRNHPDRCRPPRGNRLGQRIADKVD